MIEREGGAGEGEEAEVVAAVLGEVEEVVEVVVTTEISTKSWPVLGAAKVTTLWTLSLIDALLP
jgi:hypothetical protein